MATGKTDYSTLLAYISALGVKVYNMNHIECEFKPDDMLGIGQSMITYRGLLVKEPEAGAASSSIPVAIKVPNLQLKEKTPDSKICDILADVRQEIRMMKYFDTHPFIIDLYGVVFLDLKPAVIVELAEATVTEYLSGRLEEENPVKWDIKARFCAEVADGLHALHRANIIHGDIKGDNILLFADRENTGEFVAKIIDFGYSATAASVKSGRKIGGTLHFFAPECTTSVVAEMKKYENEPTRDNYAFGLFVWQVAMNGDVPYFGMNNDKIEENKNLDHKLTKLMTQLPTDTPEHFKTVITSMTSYDPKKRAKLAMVRQTMGLDDDARYLPFPHEGFSLKFLILTLTPI